MCVDDNTLIVDALHSRLKQEPDFEWAGAVTDGAAAFSHIQAARPDIVLLDIDLPGADAFKTVERINADMPDIRVIMFSGHVILRYVERAMDCGAWGYLSKSDDAAEIIEGIRRVARSEIALSSEVRAVQSRMYRQPGA